MKFTKHLIVTETTATKISSIERVVFAGYDNTCKFQLSGGTETGWMACNKGEFDLIVQAMESYEERIGVDDNDTNTKVVGGVS